VKVVRPAGPCDLATIQEIERSAGERFREIGMPEIADDEPAPLAELQEYADTGRAWVVLDDDERPAGFALVDVLGGCAHLEEIAVRRDAQGRGFGRRLLDQVVAWARDSDLPAVTLTTFRDVPWNGPYYERQGYRVLAEEELTPDLVAKRAVEAAHGLDPDARVCMRLDLR
jgi:GNAT superfamily N-acetyltransferase